MGEWARQLNEWSQWESRKDIQNNNINIITSNSKEECEWDKITWNWHLHITLVRKNGVLWFSSINWNGWLFRSLILLNLFTFLSLRIAEIMSYKKNYYLNYMSIHLTYTPHISHAHVHIPYIVVHQHNNKIMTIVYP